MITPTFIIGVIEKYILENKIETDSLTSKQIKDLIPMIMKECNIPYLPEHEYNSILQFFGKKYNFRFRKKRFKVNSSPLTYRNDSKDKIEIGSIEAQKYFINPSEIVILHGNDDEFTHIEYQGKKFEVKNLKWNKALEKLTLIDGHN